MWHSVVETLFLAAQEIRRLNTDWSGGVSFGRQR
jgi:hypothetical protein